MCVYIIYICAPCKTIWPISVNNTLINKGSIYGTSKYINTYTCTFICMHIWYLYVVISMYVFIALVSGLMLRYANRIAQELIDCNLELWNRRRSLALVAKVFKALSVGYVVYVVCQVDRFYRYISLYKYVHVCMYG